ncbi:hypothetical protein HDK64DRAFT_645 [Phyllosticta capitalensis]
MFNRVLSPRKIDPGPPPPLSFPFRLSATPDRPTSPNRPQTEQKRLLESAKRTTAGIRCWSPTQLLIGRKVAYLWKSGRGSEFSTCYGRT